MMIYKIHEIHYKSKDANSDLNTLLFSHQGIHYEVTFRQLIDAYMRTYGKDSQLTNIGDKKE